MKKHVIYVSMLSLAMIFASCFGKGNQQTEENSENQEEKTETVEQKEEEKPEVQPLEVDKTNNDPSYWANKYGIGQCPFDIKTTETKRFYARSPKDLRDWVYSEMNTDGWYIYNDLVISKDGKWAVGPDFESFSSFCTYEAKPYDGPSLSEEELAKGFEGVLYQVKSFIPLKITDVQLKGNRIDTLNNLEPSMYKIRNIFEEQEYISFYLSGKQKCEEEPDAQSFVYAFPHELGIAKAGVLTDELKEKAVAKTEIQNLGRDGNNEEPKAEFYIPSENGSGVGQFDLVFVYNDLISHYITIHTIQKSEE
ncbi:MAG: hypothetical protein MJ211_01430 [Bacteroidales bacterium]|nr:hypothetical protein [Bacteroidales bacterium]